MARRSQLILAGVVVASAVAVAFVGCGGPKAGSGWPAADGPKVAVSFPPLYCFAANVVGDRGTVKTVLTAQGPHHADTNVQERVILEGADLFLVNGLGLDDALAKGLTASTGNGGLKVVNLGEKLPHAVLLEPSGDCCKHDDHDHAGHAHDPHVWTSPLVAQKLVETIRVTLRTTNPGGAATYDANAAAYTAVLKKLADDGKAMLKGKADRAVVTMHGSMGYFASAYDLTVAGVIQKTPGQEPSTADLKELIAECVKQKVRVIAVEPQYGSQGAPSRLKEELERAGVADVTIVELDNLETATAAELNPGWYEAKMRANLEALAKAMK